MGPEEDRDELSLELSIGRKYGKSENLKEEEATDFRGRSEEISRFDFDFSEFVASIEPQRRREIQALRRQEARRKREEKVKKSRGVNVDDRLLLEVQKIQRKVRDREIGEEEDCYLEGKRRKNGSGETGEELELSLFTENKESHDGWLYPKVQVVEAKNSSDSENSNNNGGKSLEQCSSAVSDYPTMSHKDGSTGDRSRQSSPFGSSQRGGESVQNGSSWSSQATETTHLCLGVVPMSSNPQPSSTSEDLSKDTDTNGGGNVRSGNAGCLSRLPCVSATGNGPNGRTVKGLLYRYNATVVSIVCMCHGSSFSPAEFVQHAGGVNVSHPLRHITMVPPSLLTH